ncbi:acyl carrier protein [Geomonas sp.]|uniref:acyl carrier protein n=1 Tax=Geomonas sp. TaxID=2651584 RepID=UPI002B469E2F|nr:acyl carrier protein [Geomonas sp.]HJV34267.1 acyl carrier protein [Geomonas sp.]
MTSEIEKAKLVEYIVSDLARGKGVNGLTVSDDLVESDIMDSLGIMKLILFLEDKYSVKISDDDLTLENFSCVNSIYSLLESKVCA